MADLTWTAKIEMTARLYLSDRVIASGGLLLCMTLLVSALAFSGPVMAAADTEAGPHHVITRPLEELVYQPRYSAPATAVSLNESLISAEITARVADIPVLVGDTVERGDVLVELDCADYLLEARRVEAALTGDSARLNLAKKQLERARKLAQQKNLSMETLNQRETDVETARASLAAAQASVERAALDVSRCRITAPFDGVILERMVGVGARAEMGANVVRMLDSASLEVSAQVPVQRVGSLQAATELWFEAEDKTFPLRLRAVTPAVDTLARNREVRLMFSDEPALPGTPGRLVWAEPIPHVPASLIVRRDNQLGLMVSNDSHARFLPVPGALEGRPVPVDLPSSTMIIVDGRFGVQDGDALVVTN